jgi:hypothetical protein
MAEQKTRNVLGDDAGRHMGRMLTYEEDEAIWGEYALLFRQMLPHFLEKCPPQLEQSEKTCSSIFFIHSPAMANLAHYMLPKIEVALRRQPTNVFLWETWSAMSGLVGYRPFKDVKKALTLSPVLNPFFDSQLDLPPRQIRDPLLKQYQTRGNWQGVIDIQEWRWETIWDNFRQVSEHLTTELWTNDIIPLLKAYLCLDRTNDADELIRIWSQSPGWQTIKHSAVDQAEKHGKEILAKQWAKF